MDLAEALDPSKSGTRLAAIDLMAKREKDLDAVKTLGEIESQPFRNDVLRQQARHYGAQADKEELEARVTRDVQQRLSTMPEEFSADPVDRMMAAGQAYIDAGAVNKGAEIIQKATAAQASRATRSAAQARELQTLATQQLQELNFAQGLYENAKTPQEWDMAHQRYKQLRGEDSPFADLPFSPELTANLSRSLLSQKERIELGIREEERKARENNFKSQDRLRNARITALQTASTVAKRRLELAVKNGGRGSTEAQQVRAQLNKLQLELSKEDNLGKIPSLPKPITSKDPKDYKVGEYYQIPNGPVVRWDGKNMIEVPKAQIKASTFSDDNADNFSAENL